MKKFIVLLGLLISLLVFPSCLLADEPANESGSLTLQQAVDMAQKYNTSISANYYATETAKKELDYQERITPALVPAYNGLSNPYVPQPSYIQGQIDLLNSNYQEQLAWKKEQYNKDDVVFQTMSDYFQVQDAVESVKVAELALQAATTAYNNTQAKVAQGMATQSDLQSAKAALDKAKSQLVVAQNNEKNAYVQFDTVVGLNTSERPQLTTAVSYEPDNLVSAIGLDGVVSRAVANSPDVFQAQSQVSILGQTQAYNPAPEAGTFQYLQAQSALKQTVEQLTQNAQSAYLAVDSAEKTYQADEKQLSAAQAALEQAQKLYEVGMLVRADLYQAQLAEKQAALACQQALHNIYVARGQVALLMGTGGILPSNLQ